MNNGIISSSGVLKHFESGETKVGGLFKQSLDRGLASNKYRTMLRIHAGVEANASHGLCLLSTLHEDIRRSAACFVYPGSPASLYP